MAPNSILASQFLKIFLGALPPDYSRLDMHCMLIFCFASYNRYIQSCLPNLQLLPPPLYIGYSVIVALTGLPIGYSVIVALTGLPIGYSVIVALTGLPIGYSSSNRYKMFF